MVRRIATAAQVPATRDRSARLGAGSVATLHGGVPTVITYHRAMPDPANDRVDAARERLRHAMALHTADDIAGALAAAREAVALQPGFAEAHSYIGNTLVTRRRAFADGIAALEHAAALAPDDVAVLYTLAWCLEFAANAIDRPRSRERHQPIGRDAPTLYAQAREIMLRALALDPETGMKGDIEDILDVIASATGEPWDEEEHERAAPRPR